MQAASSGAGLFRESVIAESMLLKQPLVLPGPRALVKRFAAASFGTRGRIELQDRQTEDNEEFKMNPKEMLDMIRLLHIPGKSEVVDNLVQTWEHNFAVNPELSPDTFVNELFEVTINSLVLLHDRKETEERLNALSPELREVANALIKMDDDQLRALSEELPGPAGADRRNDLARRRGTPRS